MGRTAIHLQAVVGSGGRIELVAPPGLREGDEIDVVLLADERAAPRRSLLEVLDSLPPDVGHFKSARDVDAYVGGERDAWDQ